MGLGQPMAAFTQRSHLDTEPFRTTAKGRVKKKKGNKNIGAELSLRLFPRVFGAGMELGTSPTGDGGVRERGGRGEREGVQG